MASWHLFMQSRAQSFLLPRLGGFSVYREGLDRESLKCATRILAEARFPLVIFPEGFVTRNNDRLMNLMDGVAFLARAAAKQRAASPLPGKVVVHPVFVRYFFEGDLAAAIAPVLQEIEARLSWQPQSHLPLRDRIVKVGHALLALKEMEYFGATQSGAVRERLAHLLDHLLEPLEREWAGGRREPDSMTRIKRLRAAILPDMVHGELSEEETRAPVAAVGGFVCRPATALLFGRLPRRRAHARAPAGNRGALRGRPDRHRPPASAHPCRHLRRRSHRSNAHTGSQRR